MAFLKSEIILVCRAKAKIKPYIVSANNEALEILGDKRELFMYSGGNDDNVCLYLSEMVGILDVGKRAMRLFVAAQLCNCCCDNGILMGKNPRQGF
jgi:hypothetical protein